MAIDKIVAEYRLELDGLRKDFDAVKGQLKRLRKQYPSPQIQEVRSSMRWVSGIWSPIFGIY